MVQAPLKILTPAEYVRLHAHLRDYYARLMVDVLLESGCRWGEFAELRVGDLDPVAGTLTVARTVVEVDPKYVPADSEHNTVLHFSIIDEPIPASRSSAWNARTRPGVTSIIRVCPNSGIRYFSSTNP